MLENMVTKEEYNERLGKEIKRVREAANLKQADLAKLLGLKAYQTVGMYENGTVYIPVYYVVKISHLLKIDITELLPSIKKDEENS
jgi:transcriptional regulator with XRE-family HTH domain